jgi:hypothetical protein
MENCEKIQPLLIDFADKSLSEEHTAMVSRHLEKCKSCREEVDGLMVLFGEMAKVENEIPDEKLSLNFKEMLEQEKAAQSGKKVIMQPGNSKRITTNWLQIAAALAILIAGMLIGSQFGKINNGGEQVAELQQDLKSMKEMLILSKLQQPVASERIVAASYLEQVSAPDKDVLNALIQTMNTDKNSNVRMAAMNALTKFRTDKMVSEVLVESLAIQTDPIIQISLINILVEMQETRAVDKMKQIIEDNSTNESVKKLAEEGILTLI